MSVKDIPLEQALLYISRAADLKRRIDNNACVLNKPGCQTKKVELKIPENTPKNMKEGLLSKFPRFACDEANVCDVFESLQRCSAEYSKNKRQLIIKPLSKEKYNPQITMDLDDVTLKEIIEYICEGTGLSAKIAGNEVVIENPNNLSDKVIKEKREKALLKLKAEKKLEDDLLLVEKQRKKPLLPGRLNAVYSLRYGAAKARALKVYGGSGVTLRAVKKALKWLSKEQNKDGSWGMLEENKAPFTCFALLAFLGDGETVDSDGYGDNVSKAINYLVKTVIKQLKINGKKALAGPYTHPLVTYTLAEAFATSGDNNPNLKKAMNDSAKVIIEGMNIDPFFGEWGRENPAFSVWNYIALKSAYSAGCNIMGLQGAMLKAIKGLKNKINAGKIAGPKSDYTITVMGVLVLGVLGEGRTRESKKCYKFIKDYNPELLKNCSWKYKDNLYGNDQNYYSFAMYNWYFQTMALFQLTKGRGPLWTKWNKAFSHAFVKEQESDGSWLSPLQKYGKGHIDPGKPGGEWQSTREFANKKDLAIYATSLACLTLEVYYRYLPTTKQILDPNK